MIKEIYFKEECEGIYNGISKLEKAVSSTLGPNGKTVIITDEYGKPYVTKDGVSVARKIYFKDPVENIGASLVKEVCELQVKQAGDGPQPLYSKVLTPNGFVKISDLKINDDICGTNKSIQKVIGIYPKGQLKVYKLKFSNGQTVECSENHIWNVNTSYGVNKNLTTKELLDKGIKHFNKHGECRYNFYTPNTIVDFSKKEQILDPFLVGLLLGDGSLCKTGSIELSLALDQKYILDKIILPEGIKISYTEDLIKHYLRVKFSRIKNSGPTMHDYVEQIGLLNCKSNNKFIPDNYKYSDYDSRIKLLDGLAETDGHINKRGLLEYSTISNKLFNDVRELLSSLGKQCFSYLKERKLNSSYSNTSIYKISELQGYKNGIKLIDIIETNHFEEMMCIKVSNPDSLYITNDYIITHNTTTAIVLANAFIQNLKEFDSNDINKAFDEIIPKVIKQLKLNSKELKHEDIKYVASISANNDLQIGDIIQQAYNFSNIVKVEESNNLEDTLEMVDGMQLDVSYMSKRFTNTPKEHCELDNPNVLLLDGKLEDLMSFKTILEKVSSNDESLLIITEYISEKELRKLESNVLSGNIKLCVIKTPGFGPIRKDFIRDLSDFTGADIINVQPGKQYSPLCLGRLKSCTITKNNSLLIKHDEINVNEIVNNLKTLSENKELTDYDIEVINKRIENLTAKASIIKVGGGSEIEMKERKDRYDDAVLAVACALEEGIVSGGGTALRYVFHVLTSELIKEKNKEKDFHFKVLECLLYPYQTIVCNGSKPKLEHFLFNENIIDPLKVTRCALENAVSIAKTILSTDTVVLNERTWS